MGGSSALRNTMHCPVGRYVSSIGEMRVQNHASRPGAATDNVNCENTESRKVLLNRRIATAFAFGCVNRRSTMHADMNDDLVDPRPPCSQ